MYSLVALVVTLITTGVIYNYHFKLIEKQRKIQDINRLMSGQLQSVVLVSELAQRMNRIDNPQALMALRSRMVGELKGLKTDSSKFRKAIDLAGNTRITDQLEDVVSENKLGKKIEEFLEKFEGLEGVEIENLNKFKFELNSLSNLAFRDIFTAFSRAEQLLIEEELRYQKKIKNLGNYLIFFIAFVIIMFWGLLFHPIYKKLIDEFEEKNAALANAKIASRAKNDFLANINHEIRTPMMTILGYIELLSAKGLLGENERDEAYKTINENAGKLLTLIDEILDLSKLELGEFNVTSEKVDPRKVFSDLESIVGYKAEKKEIEFSFNIKTAIPEKVLTDAKRIKQALFNVLNNAVKFTDKGKVSMDIYFDKENSTFTCVVKDTGKGIDTRAKQEIFKMFSQENTYFDRKFSGTGLGLALTKKILNELGGDIKLEHSEPNVGSVFSMWFKVKVAPKAKNSSKIEEGLSLESLSGKKLLVVDDAVENSLIFQKYLSGAGSDVDVANSGSEALQLVELNEYDLVLLDIQMPELDGYQVLRILREENKFFKPVVALTAHAMESQKRENLRAGFDGHISKPVSSESLIASVSKFLS